ncbi:glycosyltransferase family 4 protein [Marinobacterium sp. xm-a-152]|uniref:glycosyltransferase family 4 protein n=1 Tax=Marinobacterium sp. xm-a-152 TaxID=2497733 RepID=UPI0019DE365A|nr:glycosyltransferase family 4 protein [Marinobacterium sp. xm-a-152]NRP15019.1 N,N'-diacetylbacillosaminyl-diphospho-undecaprenol alpha-1,3-N-acetylgalactosaminyltransferase [Marinobacterium sp. xm-a-152]
MRKKKLLVITANTSWYLYNFRKNTILALVLSGYKVIAIAPRDEYSQKLTALGAEFQDIKIDQGGTNPWRDFITFLAFVKCYSRIQPETVLNFTPKNNIYSTLAASMFKAQIINNIAGLGTAFIEDNLFARIVRTLYRISQPKADIIFFQNDEDQTLFEKYKISAQNKFRRIPGSGVDLTRFKVQEAIDDGCVRFLLIARMLHNKGIGYYVEAARELKKIYGERVEFRLLGPLGINNPSAVTEDEIRLWTRDEVVTYLGSSDHVEREIAPIDCIVLPSFYREGVPKSLLEACAMGKPIITTNNIGCRETVDDGVNGYLCDVKSTPSLIGKLHKMINQTHEQRIEMGRNSRIKVEKEFDEKIVINEYLNAVKR